MRSRHFAAEPGQLLRKKCLSFQREFAAINTRGLFDEKRRTTCGHSQIPVIPTHIQCIHGVLAAKSVTDNAIQGGHRGSCSLSISASFEDHQAREQTSLGM